MGGNCSTEGPWAVDAEATEVGKACGPSSGAGPVDSAIAPPRLPSGAVPEAPQEPWRLDSSGSCFVTDVRGDTHHPTVPLTWEDVTSQERHVIRHKRECRRLIEEGLADGPKADAVEPPPLDGGLRNDGDGAYFSLALSGGGMRAAAFQAGVLWRLAEEGVIQQVEYLAAVSGGGYVAASYLSHLVEDDGAIQPPGPTRLGTNMFYRAVVAKTVVRMQRNAGNFVRGGTLRELLAWPSERGFRLPRVFDFPILVFVLLATLAVNPLQFALVYLVPLSEIIHLFFGAALRTAFCSVDHKVSDLHVVLSAWSPWGQLVQVVHVLLVVNLVLWAASRLPFFRAVPETDPGPLHCRAQNRRFLVLRAIRKFLTRVIFVMAGLALVIYALPVFEIWAYSVDQPPRSAERVRYDFCTTYVDDIRHHDRGLGCANFNSDLAWFDNPPFSKTGVPEGIASDSAAAAPLERDLLFKEWEWVVSLLPLTRTNIWWTFIGCLLVVLLLSLPLVPCLPGVFTRILVLAGPLAVLGVVVAFLQFRIFGPVTGRRLFGMVAFDSMEWYLLVRLCLWSGLVTVPFYHELQRLMHWYYLRTLQTNFLAGGRDLSFRDFARPFKENGVSLSSLSETEKRCCYSPFPIFTGTVSDYETLTSDKSVHEIFFSPLHQGSDTIGFAIMRQWGMLAKYTALTGAGCLDAVSLTLSQRMRYRFICNLFNLSWGDYILFHPIENSLIRHLARYARGRCERFVSMHLHRWQNALVGLPLLFLMWFGWERAWDSGVVDCPGAKSMMIGVATVALAIFMASFFAFHPWLEPFLYSPLLRQLHMGTKYHFKGKRPPGMLYVTDGGAQDCTIIVQLIRRRRARILLVLAAADPDDELGVLRTTMQSAVEEKLCSFFDPAEPRRNVAFTLEEWAKDKSKYYFELGICYDVRGPLEGREQELGRLVVVKNRLPDDLRDMPAQPHITEDEVLGRHDTSQVLGRHDTSSAELGAMCCCDCIHWRGLNCGRKFPHLTGANYMWLTPLTFSSLCRLGYLLSKDAVHVISKEGPCES